MFTHDAIRSVFLLVIAAALVACSEPRRKDVLPTEDAPPGSALRTPSASPPLTPSAPSSADSDPSQRDAGSNDAASLDAPAPTCTTQAMWANAPMTACSVASRTYAGGTLALGEYYLSRWADGSSSCTCTSQRQGTMTIEQIGSKLYMRWTRSIDTESEAGTYLLAPEDATTMTRKEVCAEASLNEATVVKYSATSNEIVFEGDQQETWTRIQ
jgi:hypothetical protein